VRRHLAGAGILEPFAELLRLALRGKVSIKDIERA
jgi:hypothetical protein